MTIRIPQYSLVAGEYSPFLLGRSDLQKYADAGQLLENFYVDYRGGASSRPGSELCCVLPDVDARIEKFDFNSEGDNNQNYLLIFGDETLRFIFEGGLVLEEEKTISAMTAADPAVFTLTAHGYSTGDLVFITGLAEITAQYYTLTKIDNDSFRLAYPYGTAVATTSAYSGSTAKVARVYTVTTPFTHDKLSKLDIDVNGDIITITSPYYAIHKIKRFDLLDWRIEATEFVSPQAPPSNLTATPSRTGGANDKASWAYTVTAVTEGGTESVYAPPVVVRNSVNMTAEAGSVRVSWDPVAGALFYRVYRSSIALVEEGNASTLFYKPRASQLGFVGSTMSTTFVDSNIVPDFTSPPPFGNDPFSAGVVVDIDITDGGEDYNDYNTAVTITDPNGTNFLGFANVDSSGAVDSVTIINPGSGYTAPVVSITGDGTGATATAVLRTTPVRPQTSTLFQQRQLFAGAAETPLTLDGSKPGNFVDFTYTIPAVASDSFSFDIITMKINRIRHLLDMPGGLLVFTAGGVALMRGSGDSRTISAIDAEAIPQTRIGASNLKPMVIDTNVLYVQALGSTVRELEFTVVQNIYKSRDISVLANHLFTGRVLTANTYAAEPFKLAFFTRDDGVILPLSYLPEQEVFAWTRWLTQGEYKDIKAIPENTVNSVYALTRRYIQGAWRLMVERFSARLWSDIDEAWCLDAALTNAKPKPAAVLTVTETNETTATLVASSAVFSSGDVGSIVRARGGRYQITAYVSTTEVTAKIEKPAPEDQRIYLQSRIKEAASGSWSMTAPVFFVEGLHHLEGETVKVFADRKVQSDKTVVNGRVELDEPATNIVVGLSFRCRLKFLPIDLSGEPIVGFIRRPVALKLRVHDTAGLTVGSSFTRMDRMQVDESRPLGDEVVLQTGFQKILIEATADDEGVLCLEQQLPLPLTVLSAAHEFSIEENRD